MSQRWVRLSIIIIMLAVVFTSSYRLVLSEQQWTFERNGAETYDSLAWSLSLALADFHSAQRAYVANGQNPERWFEQSTSRLDSVTAGLDQLSAMSQAGEAVEALAEARVTVERLGQVDAAARAHASAQEALMASDLVFSDGQALVEQATNHMALAKSAESTTRSESIERQRTTQALAVLVSVATAVLVAFALVPLPRQSRRSAQGGDERRSEAAARPRRHSEARVGSDVAGRQGPEPQKPLPPSSPQLAPHSRFEGAAVPDLRRTAQVCTNLGRVSETGDFQDVLGQARELLNASGLIVWVRDGSGSALRAAAGHGYEPAVLSRLRHLPCDGDNATAAAYRTEQLQVVPGTSPGPGAVAVPLISAVSGPERCIGVLSAEVLHGWEESEALQATASILAAQLATLVTPDSAFATGAAEQGPEQQARAHG